MGTLTYYDPITGQWITTDDEQTGGGGVELYDGIIETRYIADLAVTDPKIASVSTSKLVGTISGTILDDNSIAWSKLDIAGVGYDQLDPGLSQDIFDTQQTADGAHALAMGRNNIYYSATEPTAPIVGDDFNHGDMWVNLGDGKKLYVYDGTNWVLAQDEDIGNLQIGLSATASRVALSANGINKVYTQATMPTGGVYGIGDTWFAPDGKIYIFNGEIWYHDPVANPDGSLPIGDTGLDAYYQNTQPTGGIYLIGDKWFDTDDNYQQYTYTRDGWRTTADAYTAMAAVDTVLTVANGKNKVVYSQNAPAGTGFVNGDMWYRTGTNETTGDTGIITLYIYENGWKAQTLTDSVLGNITASRITVGVLNGNLIQANTLMGDRIKTNTLDASKILAGSITADSAIFAEGAIRSAWIGEAQINTAHINSIDSNKITASWLEAGNIKTGALSASVIDVASLQVGSIAAQWGNALDISSNTAITLLARKDDLISYINVSPESIVINGDRVDINGALTLSNWADSNDVTKIDGGSIATNSITVNKVAAGFGQALDISSNTSITSRVTSTQLSTAMQNLVTDLQVGGSNIVVDSGYMFPSENGNFNVVGTGYTLLIDPGELYGDNASLRVTGASAGSASNKFRHLLYGEGMVGRNMVLSFFVKGSVAATGSVLTEGMATSLGTRTFPVTTSWTRVVLDMGSVTAAGTLDLNYLSMWFSAIGTFYLNSIKLEYGNKETEWSIAPQDMESQLSGLSGRIASAEQVITSDSIVNRVRDATWYQNDLSGKASTGDVAAINTLLTNNYSTIEQTSSMVSLQFGQLDSRISDVETTASNVNSSFTFGENGLLIAKSNSAFKVEITNTALNFLQGTTPIAWVNGNSMHITDATITNSLKIGAHTVSSENGITTFRLA